MASRETPATRAAKVAGYVAGGIGPVGQRKRLPTVLVSAGRRGLEIELAPADLVVLSGADLRPLARSA